MYCPTINQAKALAEKYHNSSTYKHVCRVADYIAECPGVPDAMRNDCIVLAYMHDLVEDTDFVESEIYKNLNDAVKMALTLVTKGKNESYDEYCQKLRNNSGMGPGKMAWLVKLADMKDHLNQTETLSERRKEKYLSGLRFLL